METMNEIIYKGNQQQCAEFVRDHRKEWDQIGVFMNPKPNLLRPCIVIARKCKDKETNNDTIEGRS